MKFTKFRGLYKFICDIFLKNNGKKTKLFKNNKSKMSLIKRTISNIQTKHIG